MKDGDDFLMDEKAGTVIWTDYTEHHPSNAGEKPFEEFYTKSEEIDESFFTNLGVIKNNNSRNLSEITEIIDKLALLLQKDNIDNEGIISFLSKYIPTFQYINKGKNLDQRM